MLQKILDSNYPVSFIDRIHFFLVLLTSQCLILHVMDVSTVDVGWRWYQLLTIISFTLVWLEHYWSCSFLLLWENEIWSLAPEMDGILLGSKSCSPFLYLRQELEKLIDLKCNEGNILQFLNLCIIQNYSTTSMDKPNQIKTHLLDTYFKGSHLLPFTLKHVLFLSIQPFECALFGSQTFAGSSLHSKEKHMLLHITI